MSQLKLILNLEIISQLSHNMAKRSTARQHVLRSQKALCSRRWSAGSLTSISRPTNRRLQPLYLVSVTWGPRDIEEANIARRQTSSQPAPSAGITKELTMTGNGVQGVGDQVLVLLSWFLCWRDICEMMRRRRRDLFVLCVRCKGKAECFGVEEAASIS